MIELINKRLSYFNKLNFNIFVEDSIISNVFICRTPKFLYTITLIIVLITGIIQNEIVKDESIIISVK